MPRNTLLVGAKPELVEILKELISQDGREVRTALNGAQAIARMSERSASTVVIDDDLEDFSGSDLAHHLKAIAEVHFPSKPCCAIAVRGDFRPGDVLKVSGFDYVLTKPLEYERILQLLADCDVQIIRAVGGSTD